MKTESFIRTLVTLEEMLPRETPEGWNPEAIEGVVKALRLAVQGGVEDQLWWLCRPFSEQVALQRNLAIRQQTDSEATDIAERWASQPEEVEKIQIGETVFSLSVRGRVLSSKSPRPEEGE